MPTLWETLDRFGMIPEVLAGEETKKKVKQKLGDATKKFADFKKNNLRAWGSGGGHKLPNPSHNPTSRVKKFGHKFPNSSIGGHPQNVRTVI